MTYIQAHGHATRYNNVDSAADASAGPQGPALISELRRLQNFLEQERYQEPEQFPRAGEIGQPTGFPSIGPTNEESRLLRPSMARSTVFSICFG